MTVDGFSFQWVSFSEIDAAGLYEFLAFRQRIFIVEQCSAYADLDGLDPDCAHLRVRDHKGHLAAYLRARGPTGAEPAFIGRIVVHADWRGTGLGRRLITEGLEHMERHYPGCPIRIGAQQHLAPYYSQFGFVTEGAPYQDGGIPHVAMWRGRR